MPSQSAKALRSAFKNGYEPYIYVSPWREGSLSCEYGYHSKKFFDHLWRTFFSVGVKKADTPVNPKNPVSIDLLEQEDRDRELHLCVEKPRAWKTDDDSDVKNFAKHCREVYAQTDCVREKYLTDEAVAEWLTD